VKLTRKEKGIVRHALYKRSQGRCEQCGIGIIQESGRWSSMHAAHIVSKARGGPFTLENLRALCIACHLIGEHRPKSVPRKAYDAW
jgi:5-methylcytosine-specific restriction enzyme A